MEPFPGGAMWEKFHSWIWPPGRDPRDPPQRPSPKSPLLPHLGAGGCSGHPLLRCFREPRPALGPQRRARQEGYGQGLHQRGCQEPQAVLGGCPHPPGCCLIPLSTGLGCWERDRAGGRLREAEEQHLQFQPMHRAV